MQPPLIVFLLGQVSIAEIKQDLRNMCMTEYSTTLNADGITEETVTFYGNTKPVIGTTANTTLTALADF